LKNNETFLVIWLNWYWLYHSSFSDSTVCRNTYLQTLTPCTHQLRCQWCFGPCHSKRAASAASVLQCCAPKEF